MRTKNRKTITSNFFPVKNDFEQIVRDWIDFLRTEKLFGPDDPLFPATRVGLDAEGHFAAAGYTRDTGRTPMRSGAFLRSLRSGRAVILHTHSFRKTLGNLGERLCSTPEAFKAWSQNLSHEHVLTTFTSYGAVSSTAKVRYWNRYAYAVQDGGTLAKGTPDAATIQRVLDHLKRTAA